MIDMLSCEINEKSDLIESLKTEKEKDKKNAIKERQGNLAEKENELETTKENLLKEKLNDQLAKITKEKNQAEKQLEEYVLKVNEQVEEIALLKEASVTEKNSYEKLKKDVTEMEAMCRSVKKEMEEERKRRRSKMQAQNRRSVEQNRVALDQMDKLLKEKIVSQRYHSISDYHTLFGETV